MAIGDLAFGAHISCAIGPSRITRDDLRVRGLYQEETIAGR